MMGKMLKEAAQRCEDYRVAHGVDVVWSLEPIGFRCEGRNGVDRVTKYLDYEVADNMLTDRFIRTEEAVLQGLSS